MPKIHVVDVPEFSGLIECARGQEGVRVSETRKGYITISSDEELVFTRRGCGFKPALWYTCLSGGIDGSIREYGRDTLRIGEKVAG
ncbi:hypothetical protein [Sphingobium chlorophenolicum]|uniref:Uncharacterized protein n=1 Tax=Sphingobium chlorophenolicum TaxID=46429 RepID=A0A081R9D2_SPHCR|nr:hypothetical protein [Sphingobium chlorophenolicum]KEQ51805.1 hypothetical protein BV95_03941 [Sphingobium chlorophenolicum]